jgi:hypothetical protein
MENGKGHYTIAFDPSYIFKSGKSTSGVGWYCSEIAGKDQVGFRDRGQLLILTQLKLCAFSASLFSF